MTLHHWYELECGNGNDHGSWSIERDEQNGLPYLIHHHYYHGKGKDQITKHRIPDREKGALKRLGEIQKRYPSLTFYCQTDPRGAPLYVLRPGDVPEGENVDSYYSRGICVAV